MNIKSLFIKKNNSSESILIFSIFFVLSVFLLSVLYLNQGPYSGDCVWHYVISRYSFQYPYLFLDHWGKPVFTTLSSPFSQFGFKGTELFNVITALITSYVIYRIAKKLNYKYPYVVIFFVLFIPLYFRVCFSGLTEICFSCVLSISILLYLNKKYIPGTLILSFLPFVRTEGILLFPTFLIILLYRKQWKNIWLMSVGTLFYTLIGAFYYNDFFWVINKCPYKPAKSFYGSGPLLSYVKELPYDMGWLLLILFIIGLIVYIVNLIRQIKNLREINNFLPEEILLIAGNFIIYFAAHSLLWYLGIFNSYGMTRVIDGVFPLAAIISLKGLNQILNIEFFKKSILYSNIFIVLIILIIIRIEYQTFRFPLKLESVDEVIYAAKAWIKENKISYNKIYYFHPTVITSFGINPFDKTYAEEAWYIDKSNPSKSMPSKSIFIWDEQFSPKEGGFPLKALQNDKDLLLLKEFYPSVPLKFRDDLFKVCVFYKK
jgi:hypothetical protein